MLGFSSRVKRAVKRCGGDPEAAADEFHGMYEDTVLGYDEMFVGLKKLPRPFRELAAAHQAWGMISSDGFDSYVEAVDDQFDTEVENGLKLLNLEQCMAPLREARQRIESTGTLDGEDEKRLFNSFYDPFDDGHEKIGQYLVTYCN